MPGRCLVLFVQPAPHSGGDRGVGGRQGLELGWLLLAKGGDSAALKPTLGLEAGV